MATKPNLEEKLYTDHEARVRAGKPRIAALIEEISGWHGVDDLADWVVDLIVSNQGRSAGDIRPPCWNDHSPRTVSELTQSLMQASGLPENHPHIQGAVAKYRQDLIKKFELEP